MISRRYRFLLFMLIIMYINALSCQREGEPEVTGMWSGEPHVDSALAYHFAVLQRIVDSKPFSYDGEKLDSSVVFFENLTGIASSASLSTVGIIYYRSDLVSDYQKWRSWCQMNKDKLVWHSAGSRIVFDADSTQSQ